MTSLESNPSNESPPLAVINATHSMAWQTVGGIPLIARWVYHLNALGASQAYIITRNESPAIALDRWRGALCVESIPLEGDIPATLMNKIGSNAPVLYADATCVIDPRLIGHLVQADAPTLVFPDFTDAQSHKIRAGLLQPGDIVQWARKGEAAVIERAQILLPENIDPFCPETRGKRVPYFKTVRTSADAHNATRMLVESMQKKVMDLPSEYIDPYFENRLTLLLMDTPISPNMVTFIGLAAAMAVTWLFWHGWFIAGAWLTLVVEILDGVDGKLARTRLQFSKIGAHEDIIDYFYENSWYAALGIGLSHFAQSNWPLYVAGLLIFADTTDNIFYTLAGKWHGKSIDLFSHRDALFRKIAGRRNIYGWMFIIGFTAGYPIHTFITAAAWALITAGVHGVRLGWHGQTQKESHASEESL